MTSQSEALQVVIYSSTAELRKIENVDAIRSKNTEGEFSVLPNHAQFLSLVQGEAIDMYKGEKVVDTVNCDKAIIHVKNNIVNIYTNLD